MTSEQPGLFEELAEQLDQARTEAYLIAEAEDYSYLPFLPGVEVGQAYPEIKDLGELAGVARECRRCRLRESCSQVVFGEGPPDARLMLIGEGPGQDEDIQGRPFVGKAGQLLDKILEAAGIQRSQVYIGNVVKCRPPGNRLPNPDEVKECRKYLERQIKLIRPSIIVCLGSMASQTVIDPNAKITRIRGRWLIRQGIKIMPTYHPAALLRNPSYKRPVWEDFKQIRDEYRNCR
ncbi:MAG: uracil-DNA glycosylase [Syntrophomonadaceae bacterium]|jgi:uracil-DNA glycosylase family 4|nr:uracil-DNA glycosylase [Syntrophomonadaceae bacterium]